MVTDMNSSGKNSIDLVLEEARWIGKIAEDQSWLEKIVEHTTPGGQRRKVKVKSLPPEEREKYRPAKQQPQDKKVKQKIQEKK